MAASTVRPITRLSRADTGAMYATVVIAAIAVVAVVVVVIQRLLEVVDGQDVPVTIPLSGETAALPLGPDGSDVTVTVEQATVVVPHPAAATQFAIVSEPILVGVVSVVGIALLALFCLNIARGRAFSRGNLHVVGGATVVVAVGMLGGWLLSAMTVNGALSAVSDYSYDGTTFAFSPIPFFGILALGALVAAFQIGHRLQRETEGLV